MFNTDNIVTAFAEIGIDVFAMVENDERSLKICGFDAVDEFDIEIYVGISTHIDMTTGEEFENKWIIVVNHTVEVVKLINVTVVYTLVSFKDFFNTEVEWLEFLKSLGYKQVVAYKDCITRKIKLVDTTYYEGDGLYRPYYIDIQNAINRARRGGLVPLLQMLLREE